MTETSRRRKKKKRERTAAVSTHVSFLSSVKERTHLPPTPASLSRPPTFCCSSKHEEGNKMRVQSYWGKRGGVRKNRKVN